MMTRRRATLSAVYSWESQVHQYLDAPAPETEGVTYYPGWTPGGVVDCLLYWKPTSTGRMRIVGILNHYPIDFPPLEIAGNVNIWVRVPNQRQGVATALLEEAASRWKINLDQQRFTAAGAALAEAWERSR